MDGGWHKKDNLLAGKTKEETKKIDNYKDLKAIEHDITIIRIDCEKSELEYIKNNILNSKISELFNIDDIDWIKCYEYACKSLILEASNMWKDNINITDISNILKKDRHTIRAYLKQGAIIGLCDYSPEKSLKNHFINMSKKVYCIELDKVFESTMDVERELKLFNTNISFCCRNQNKTAGGYHWMYYEDYIKQY